MNMILYSTGCSRCKVLEELMKEKHLNYETVTDESVMLLKKIQTVPVLEFNGKMYQFPDALKLVRSFMSQN